jgi:hypothetical protein
LFANIGTGWHSTTDPFTDGLSSAALENSREESEKLKEKVF